MSRDLSNLSRFIELLQHGAYIRYGLAGNLLICNDEGLRENVNEPTMQVLCQRRLVTRGGLVPNYAETPHQWPARQRIRAIQSQVRYTWSGREPRGRTKKVLAASASA